MSGFAEKHHLKNVDKYQIMRSLPVTEIDSGTKFLLDRIDSVRTEVSEKLDAVEQRLVAKIESLQGTKNFAKGAVWLARGGTWLLVSISGIISGLIVKFFL